MKLEQAIIFMLVVCAIVLIIVFAKNKTEVFVNVILRMVFGAVSLHLLNTIFLSQEIDVLVGVNLGTIGTIGALGIPGFVLLYAIAFFNLF
ncbi:pro-sigmaK processing inhibitor BofA family protein [Candidatus Galacturonibacter soehngenii]|uniref:Transcriptional regulator n=1 Tax=Candidatus Galacturonatibacter soehngenii TaxID=2307010 RepID=A0A7V7UGN5_9FIRM|nr:pro-sigmaK processing inhibitor BofA family protein [Candidatus Galacturonibacter soehngenii]KAB1438641.1 transcriptional regulator [Candidatus Galacturonibacter soehngenii]MBA4685670.1 pro-sigmaK processing inhibitor BofA family protein [Candidatus Galacturonibacter soehngenii]